MTDTTPTGTWEDAMRQLERYVRERNEARAEVERLRKIFDDAGQGEHNVLALIDHYQRSSMEADDRLRDVVRERDEALAEVERLRSHDHVALHQVAEDSMHVGCAMRGCQALSLAGLSEALTSEQARELMREGEQVARDFRARMRCDPNWHKR